MITCCRIKVETGDIEENIHFVVVVFTAFLEKSCQIFTSEASKMLCASVMMRNKEREVYDGELLNKMMISKMLSKVE